MKVKIIKHHLHYKPNDEVELDDGIAGYLMKVRVATPVNDETPEDTEKELAKKLKSAKKKK